MTVRVLQAYDNATLELLQEEARRMELRRGKQVLAEFVDPLTTLRAVYPGKCKFSLVDGMLLLHMGDGRTLSVRCADPATERARKEEELARTALRNYGITRIQQQSVRERPVSLLPVTRKRARGGRTSVSDLSLRYLIDLVCTRHNCARHELQMVLRKRTTADERTLLGIAVEVASQKVIEPRAYFESEREAMRDALIHASDPPPEFIRTPVSNQ